MIIIGTLGSFGISHGEMSVNAKENNLIDTETAIGLVKNARDILLSYEVRFQWFTTGTGTGAGSDKSQDISIENFNGWNMNAFFRPVKSGFDADGVKKLVRDTFTAQVAANYIEQETFFNCYYTRGDTLYYFINYGAQLGDFSSLELTDAEIGELYIDSLGRAVVKTSFIHPYISEFNREINVYFFFESENGVWKVSNMDAAGSLFSLYGSDAGLSPFSETLARNEIETLVGEIYRITHVDGDIFAETLMINDSANGEPSAINISGQEYFRVGGVEGMTDTWFSYAARFATEEIAEKLVKEGHYCIPNGDRMYYRGRRSAEGGMAFLGFLPENFDKARYEQVSVSDDKATVNVTLPVSKDHSVEFNVDFSLTDGQWKVSGGNFIEILDALYAPDAVIPGTGDGSITVYTALTCMAFAVLVLAGRIYRSRRRIPI